MKKSVLFLLGDCPAYYVEMMYLLAKRVSDNGHNVIVAATSPYYEKYKNVDFSKFSETHYFSDFASRKFDCDVLDETPIDWWGTYPTFVRDRYFFGRHRNNWSDYKRLVLFFREIFDRKNIQLVVGEPASNSFLYLAYLESKRKDCKYLGFLSARVPNSFNVFLDPFGEQMLLNTDVTGEEITSYSGPPDYVTVKSEGVFQHNSIVRVWRFLRFMSIGSVETGNTALHQLNSLYKKFIWRKIRYLRARISGVFASDISWKASLTILYPLPFRPESSTSVLAKYYDSDFEIIKNIAFSLPNNAQLVVKEHSPANGIREQSFYRDTLSLPNVVLLSPDYDLREHLHKFDAIVVLSGTAGFEACQIGVPVFLLGKAFYANYPGITKIDSFSGLEKVIRGLKKQIHQANPEPIKIYSNYCFPGRFDYLGKEVLSESNIEKLYSPIKLSLVNSV